MVEHGFRRRLLGGLVAAAGIALTALPAAGSAYASGGGVVGRSHPVPLAASCSGLGTTTDGITWNGCVVAGAGLNVRAHSGTGPVSRQDLVVFTYPVYTLVHVECTLGGFNVNGSTLWDAVDVFREPGGPVVFFTPADNPFPASTDFYIFTGTDNPIAPHC
jgi:hypothetical protein